MNIQFVDGWTIVQTLGEGTFGEVKLLVNTNSRLSVAMKTIDLKNHPDALETGRKEAAIHCRLKHPNIVAYFGHRHTTDFYYIFLEYASGGELFDQIEPDVGMQLSDAKKYFKELLAGVEYMHSKGVAHRDLKPENLLLNEQGVLKISDFGLATMFLCGEKRRKLEKKCGTKPYMAPEVYVNSPYQAEPADIWSCGVILVAMLAGELPWDEPINDVEDYKLWKTNYYVNHSPWNKLDTSALSLVRKILTPAPSKRYDMFRIKSHYWLELENRSGRKLDVSLFNRNPGDAHLCFSQPAPQIAVSFAAHTAPYESKTHYFTQPTQIDNMLVSSQQLTPKSLPTPNNPIQKLAKRMTRFTVRLSPEESLTTLSKLLDDMEYIWKINTPGSVTITTDECFVFKCNLISINHETLMDFRLSKGCGLKFKRHFICIKMAMFKIINSF